MTESYFRLTEEVQVTWDLILAKQGFVVVRVSYHLLGHHWSPAICSDRVLVDVAEDVGFVPSTVDVEVVELSDESVVGSGLGCILRVEIYPFVLKGFILG